MQPNKTKIALVIGALLLGASGASNAVQGSFDITIATIADLSVTEIQPLSFGSSVFTTGSAVCNIAGNDPLFSDVLAEDNTVIDGATSYLATDATLTGSGCAGSGRVGIYEVVTAGLADSISVTVNAVSNADFTFNPNSNCLPNYAPGTALNACLIMAPGVPNTGAQTGSTTPGEGSIDKTLRFTVGGSLTTAVGGLAPATPYSDVFSIDVIYQ